MEKPNPNPPDTTVQSQRTKPGTPVVIGGVEFISLGQVMWQTVDHRLIIADMVMGAADIAVGASEIRDVKVIIRAARIIKPDVSPPPGKPN